MKQIELIDYQQSIKTMVIGADECGYGSVAGPVCIGAVLAPKDWSLEGLNDSKKLTENKRNIMRAKLLKLASDNVIKYHIAERDNIEIDKIGILAALKNCYIECIKLLDIDLKSLIIFDGTLNFDNLNVDAYDINSLIKADTLIPTVMAASILAKTYRDEKMRVYDKQYPEYYWKSNVGYPASAHIEAIRKIGYSPLHRMSYKIKSLNK